MRIFVVVLIAIVLGGLFLLQKQHEQKAAPVSAAVAAKKPATPRPVSEHNWAKHSLDTTRKVTDQIAKQRQEDSVRK